MSNIQIVTVVNNFDCYNRTIKNNQFMNKYDLSVFDNNKENLGISFRYNSFIKDKILNGDVKDSWIIFCHQDFGFLSDPLTILEKQDKNCIYGTVGAKKRFPKLSFDLKKSFPIYVKHKKSVFTATKQGFHSKQYFNLNEEEYFKNNDSLKFWWSKFELLKVGDELFYEDGNKITKPTKVDTLDCCCIIAHSSLFNNNNLTFDENLTFHFYSEDLSLNAKYNHNIDTKVLPINSFHRGEGNADELFFKSFEYVKEKYKGRRFVGTCFNCDW